MRKAQLDQLLQRHPTPWTEIAGEPSLARDARGQHIALFEVTNLVGLAVSAVNAAGAEGPFLRDVRARSTQPLVGGPIGSLGEAWVILGKLLVELQEVIERATDVPKQLESRQKLVEIATVAWRAAKDLGIENPSEAIIKDIPF